MRSTFLWFLILSIISGLGGLQAQQAIPADSTRLEVTMQGHAALQKSRDAIRSKEQELESANAKEAAQKPPPEVISALVQQISELKKQYDSQEQSLRAQVYGVTGLEGARPEPENVEKEIKEVIVRPLVDMAKDLVARQRGVALVKAEIAEREQVSAKYATALENILTLTEQAKPKKDTGFQEYLRNRKKVCETEKSSVDLQLANLRTRLAELEAEKKPLSKYAGELFRKGILHRVGNLLLAVLAFIGVMGLFRLALRVTKDRLDFEHLSARPFLWRVINLVYYVGSLTAAALAALLVLYASDDWFLLTMAMVVIVGVALAARNTLPKIYEQAKLLLNLGATREGERLTYQGLPWLVRRMNIYCELINPALAGGEQRIALRHVVNMASRPVAAGEKWFPTEVNDWILMPDGTPARVTHQSPEFVQLFFNGGATQSFRTLDFLALNARVLSNGFRLLSRLQVDFKHAPDVNSISEILRSAVNAGLQVMVEPGCLKNLVVELESISSSSLLVMVQSDFAGSCAPKYFELRREVQQLSLACATQHGWIIPYQQLVLHQAKIA